MAGSECDAGSFNGRTRVFEARYGRSIRPPAARFTRSVFRGVLKATVTSFSKKNTGPKYSTSRCEVIQVDRITGSDPVHARSNRALAAKFREWSQSLAAGCLTVYQEGRVQLPLRPPQG
jgi:hypothetical protein